MRSKGQNDLWIDPNWMEVNIPHMRLILLDQVTYVVDALGQGDVFPSCWTSRIQLFIFTHPGCLIGYILWIPEMLKHLGWCQCADMFSHLHIRGNTWRLVLLLFVGLFIDDWSNYKSLSGPLNVWWEVTSCCLIHDTFSG